MSVCVRMCVCVCVFARVHAYACRLKRVTFIIINTNKMTSIAPKYIEAKPRNTP